MKDKAIKKFITEKVTELSDLAGKISKDFDKEAIHDFRTTAKMLRSFLRLLHVHTHKNGVKLSKEFRQLYAIAGTIREAQLEQENFIQKQLLLPAYTESLRKIMSHQKTEWGKCYSDDVFENLASGICAYDFGAIHTPLWEGFYKNKTGAMKELSVNACPTDTQIHDVRKAVKDILYTSKIAKKHWPDAYDYIQQMPIDKLNEIADAIGNYHDGRVTLEHLCAFSSPDMDDKEKKMIQNFCDEEAAKLMNEKSRVLAMMASFN